MLGRRQYKRSVRVLVGPSFNTANIEGEGLRISFEVNRNSRSDPDRGTIQIYNLSESSRSFLQNLFEEIREARKQILSNPLLPDVSRGPALFALEKSFQVRLFAGYGKVPEQIFQGNLVELIKEERSGSTDYVTTLKVGDGLTAYRDSYISESFAPGVSMENFRQVLQLAMGLSESPDAAAVVSAVAPQATVTAAANGLVVVGKPSDALNDLAELYGLQWWIRDGQIYYVPQGAVTLDFSVLLQEGLNLLAYTTPKSYGDVEGRSLLNPNIHPGRGMFVVKLPRATDLVYNPLTGLRGEHVGSSNGLRCEIVSHYGDTHGQAWYTDFQCRAATVAIAAPTLEFTDADVTALVNG